MSQVKKIELLNALLGVGTLTLSVLAGACRSAPAEPESRPVLTATPQESAAPFATPAAAQAATGAPPHARRPTVR